MKKLGPLESRMLAYAQMRDLSIVKSGDMVAALGISKQQEREVLSRLARSGMIAQVRRGLYLFPDKLPLGGQWSPGELQTLAALMEDRGATYQITGPNAFNRYGFDDQVPARLYAYNDKISGDRTVGPCSFTFIKVAPPRLGDVDTPRTREGTEVSYSSRTRTLLDAVCDWSRFNSLPRAYEWIQKELDAGRVKAEELVRSVLRFGNQSTMRRIGALLEREGKRNAILKPLEKSLRTSSSFIPWIPTRPKHGKRDTRWGVVWNDETPE